MARKQAFPGPGDFDEAGREPDGDGFADDVGPSKSELKRQDRDLRALGVELAELPLVELDALNLPEKLYDAIVACRKITAHGARLRQEMYVAKVMRHVDVTPIRAALQRRGDADRLRVRREHGLEQWRERLLADESDAWTELAGLITEPSALQQLRSLARQARAESAVARPPAAARQLFRRLRELLENAGS
ncbi:MAG: ribosome biogenesis factor YjgA [Steroidobacteraceae bacterium]